jgi:uncharacterized lipoprotein NlpE involved in copper resistance
MTLTLTTGDTAPALTGTVNADLTGATAEVHIKRPDRTVLTKAATITDAETGAWSIEWDGADLAQSGHHYVEVEVTFASGDIQTFSANSRGEATRFSVRSQYA